MRYLLFALTAIRVFGQVSIGSTSAPTPSTYVVDAALACGVVGDKVHDDTTAINNCILNTPNYATIWFRPNLKMKITSTINWLNKSHFALVGSPGAAWQGPSTSDTNAAFFWYGADGGTMLNLDGADSFAISNLTFFSSGAFTVGTGGANVGINVDETLAATQTTTNGILDRVAVLGTQQNTNFQGIYFAATSNVNVEHMTVRDSTITCSYSTNQTNAVGQGIIIGASQNAQGNVFEGNTITSCAGGIWSAFGGIASVVHNQFNNNVVHIHFGQPYSSIDIRDNDSENCIQFFTGEVAGGGFFFNRIAAAITPPTGKGTIEITGGGSAIMEGNKFDRGAYIPISLDVGQGAALFSTGNSWPDFTNTLIGLSSFGYGQLAVMEGLTSGTQPLFMTSGTSALVPTAGFGQMTLLQCGTANSCAKWMANEGSGAARYIVPDVQSATPSCDVIGRIWFNTTTTTTVENHCESVSGTLTWVTK